VVIRDTPERAELSPVEWGGDCAGQLVMSKEVSCVDREQHGQHALRWFAALTLDEERPAPGASKDHSSSSSSTSSLIGMLTIWVATSSSAASMAVATSAGVPVFTGRS